MTLLLSMAVSIPAADAVEAAECGPMDLPIYQRVNPRTQANLLTRSQNEAVAAGARYGFTEDRGISFLAASQPTEGLVSVHRLYQATTGDFIWMTAPAEIKFAVEQLGYMEQGVNFAAAEASGDCREPVHRLFGFGKHRFTASAAERDALVAAGWSSEGIAFYAAPPNGGPANPPVSDTKFSIAIVPDTQVEVTRPDPRLADRTRWLADHRNDLDLRFVLHTGDVINWDTPDHAQLTRASEGMRPLENAGIPWAVALGNHDTAAVCPGGSACPDRPARIAVRDTTSFNQFFPSSRFANLQGQFETGKVDNAWSIFQAGGKEWMVLSLEIWPRREVIDWAASVVQSHPRSNVIIFTHAYLDAAGNISQDRGGYGATSPQYLYDRVVSRYPNVRMVFSGHVGTVAARYAKGGAGNPLASFLGHFHEPATNPVRIVEIDTLSDTVRSRFYAPYTDSSYPQYDRQFNNMDWVD